MSNNSHSNNRNQTLSNTDLTHETDDTNPPLNTKSNEELNTRAGSLPTVVNAPSPSTGKCRLSICICILLRNSVLPCFQINSFHSQTKTNSTLCKFFHRRYSVDSTSRTGTAHRRGRGTGQWVSTRRSTATNRKQHQCTVARRHSHRGSSWHYTAPSTTRRLSCRRPQIRKCKRNAFVAEHVRTSTAITTIVEPRWNRWFSAIAAITIGKRRR